MVVTWDKVYMQQDMIAQVQDRNSENDLIPSILISKVEEVVHIESDSHAAKVESDLHYDRNMVMHYNHKNVVEVQEPYLHLPEANFFMLP